MPIRVGSLITRSAYKRFVKWRWFARIGNPLPRTERIFLGGEAQAPKVYTKELFEVAHGLDAKAKALIFWAYEKACVAFAAARKPMRLSGRPFVEHLVDTAHILRKIMGIKDPVLLAAGILHDVLEDTKVTYEELLAEFGQEVAALVEAETKLSVELEKEYRDVESLKKLIKAGLEDPRVLLLKAADSLSNMKDQEVFPKEKREEHALEAMNYARLMWAMGVWEMREKLEEAAIKYLEPEKFQEIYRIYETALARNEGKFDDFIDGIKTRLERAEIGPLRIELRQRTFAEVYRRMNRDKKTLDELLEKNPLFLNFILVEIDNKKKNCALAIDLLRSGGLAGFNPVDEWIKDRIKKPRPDGYRAQLTKFSRPGLRGQLLVTATTMRMNTKNRLGPIIMEGISSNFKQGWHELKYPWLMNLLSSVEGVYTSGEMRGLIEEFTSYMSVRNEENQEFTLHDGSKALDFAFAADSQRALYAIGAKINGSPVPLDAELREDDIVEIIYGDAILANPMWLSWVRTTDAAEEIVKYLQGKATDEQRELGKIAINIVASKYFLEWENIRSIGWMNWVLEDLNKQFGLELHDPAELAPAVGQGKIDPVGFMKIFNKSYSNILQTRLQDIENRRLFVTEMFVPNKKGILNRITRNISEKLNMDITASLGIAYNNDAEIILVLPIYSNIQRDQILFMLREMLKGLEKDQEINWGQLRPEEFEELEHDPRKAYELIMRSKKK